MTDANHLNSKKHTRQQIVFRGQVQGVGFRQTCLEQAIRHSVVGWVRNMPNGEVHLVAEAPVEILARFVQAIQSTTFGHVQDKRLTESAATNEFPTFTIG